MSFISNSFNVSSVQVRKHFSAVIKIDGYFRSTTSNPVAAWLQVHDSNATPTTGDIPRKQWPVYDTSEFYKEFKNGELDLALGCFIGLSSTEGTWTADVTNKIDVSTEIINADPLSGSSFAGDLTSAVTGLAVWTDAAGPKRLLAAEIDTTNLTANGFLQVFAKDSPADGDLPVVSLPVLKSTAYTGSSKFVFGDRFYPFSQTTAGVGQDGCTIKISSTGVTLTLIVAQTVTIKAEYI